MTKLGSKRARRPGREKRQALFCRLSLESLEDRRLPSVGLISFNSANNDTGNTGSTFSNSSADGRYIVFQSAATDLVKGIHDANSAGGDIFVRDRLTNTTTLASINRFGTATGNNSSMNPVISANGRFVVFESLANDLVANDTNDSVDVFVRDLVAKTTKLVSVNRSGHTTLGASSTISDSPQMPGRFISDDGRYVVFQSNASDLVPNDTNAQPDVFVRDLVANTTTLVSINGAGTASGDARSDHPVISADGRYVAFDSDARDLVRGLTDFSFHRKVFVRDLLAKSTTLASTNKSGGATVDDDSFLPQISGDGRVVAFSSYAHLAANDTNTFPDVYVRDLRKTVPTLVSASLTGGAANYSSFDPVISDDGRFVAFDSLADNLVSNDNDGHAIANKDVFERNLQTNTTTLVSVNSTGTGGGDLESRAPSISGDGRFVAYESHATNLVAGFVRRHENTFAVDIFLRDVIGKTTTLVNAALGSTTHTGNNSANFPVVSRDGRFVSFQSMGSDLVSRDSNGIQTDVFVSPAAYQTPPAVVLQLSATAYSVAENAGKATITVTRSGPSYTTVQVHYATSNGTAIAGADYTAVSGTLTLTPGQTVATFAVPITDDHLPDSTETVHLTLSSAAGGAILGSRSSAVLSILDNDAVLLRSAADTVALRQLAPEPTGDRGPGQAIPDGERSLAARSTLPKHNGAAQASLRTRARSSLPDEIDGFFAA
jgi:Tol biopolymer transport system component